jgi:transcriptional regulator with XRE-family HTH domain
MLISTDKTLLLLFGSNVRKIRITRGKTQEQLADDIGASQVQIARIENGTVNTTVFYIFALSKALNVDAGDFFRK